MVLLFGVSAVGLSDSPLPPPPAVSRPLPPFGTIPLTKTPPPNVLPTGAALIRDDGHDRALLARLAAGDSDALGELYDRHAPGLYRHARALTRQRDEAEDLVQSVFVKVATSGASLLGVREPAGYLHRVLSTCWIDTHRARSVRREQPLDAATGGAGLPSCPDAALDAGIDVERALFSLPDGQREVVLLHVVLGFSFRETGHIVGATTFTVASRYRLAIARLRTALGGR